MSADYKLLRTKMVDGQLRTTGITDSALLQAMLEIPREAFLAPERAPFAYIDEDIEVAPAGGPAPARYLMEPAPFAQLVQLAGPGRGDHVLDVGCATGYSAAVLSRLAGDVVALESDPELASFSREALGRLGSGNVSVVEGPLTHGHAEKAPYDVIFVGGAVDEVPDALFAQLADGGRLVAVVGQGNAGFARLFVRTGEVVSGRRAFNAAVRPLPGFQKAPEFQF